MNTLNHSSPAGAIHTAHPVNLLAWMQERFPPANALLFFILYLATAAVVKGEALGTVQVGLFDLLACVITWSFFLLLRVLDEHKDYELDCLNHPQRVLQSGRITLGYLKGVGAVSVAAQLGLSLWLDQGMGPVTTAWAVMMVWASLMAKEFFIPEWLGRHLTWYALSHMLVMPLIVFWLANLAHPGTALTPDLAILMLLAFVSGFCFEITRKTKGTDEERDTVESYSRIFGTRGAAWIVVILVTTMLLIQYRLSFQILGTLPWWTAVVPAAGYALALNFLRQFFATPTAKARGKNEAAVALNMLIAYAVLIAVEISQHGLSLSGGL